jgi:hypothetical protein
MPDSRWRFRGRKTKSTEQPMLSRFFSLSESFARKVQLKNTKKAA